MAGQVAVLWRDITEWLRRNAPASAAEIRPNSLCADLRDGPRHGGTGEWNHEGGWDNELFWESVTDMRVETEAVSES